MPDKRHNELERRVLSFRYAFRGWGYVLRTQRNAWIHAAASVAVIALALWLNVGRTEWALLVLAMAIVWAAELANTAVEAIVDLVAPTQHPLAKVAKDVSAGAVLASAFGAAIVGLLVLAPPLIRRLTG